MTDDLYMALGVARDADRAEIRRAYRDKARSAHPDVGGSPEEFARIKVAHDTLTDEARRQRYDETGEVEDTPLDPHSVQLLDMLAASLDLAMLKLSKQSLVPKNSDMVQLTREALDERRQGWFDLRSELEKTAVRSRELLGRFSGGISDNLMETVVVRRLGVCQKEIEALDERIKLADEALEVLNRTAFQADREPPPSSGQHGPFFWGDATRMQFV
jgi:curved DNA-binding protein CbpA